jgi:hypothetical protein
VGLTQLPDVDPSQRRGQDECVLLHKFLKSWRINIYLTGLHSECKIFFCANCGLIRNVCSQKWKFNQELVTTWGKLSRSRWAKKTRLGSPDSIQVCFIHWWNWPAFPHFWGPSTLQVLGPKKKSWKYYAHAYLFLLLIPYFINVCSPFIMKVTELEVNPCPKIKTGMWKYEGVSKRFRTESMSKYMVTTINTHSEATQRATAEKLNRLTHKIAIQLHLVAETCTIYRSRSKRPVRELLDTPSKIELWPYQSSGGNLSGLIHIR